MYGVDTRSEPPTKRIPGNWLQTRSHLDDRLQARGKYLNRAGGNAPTIAQKVAEEFIGK